MAKNNVIVEVTSNDRKTLVSRTQHCGQSQLGTTIQVLTRLTIPVLARLGFENNSHNAKAFAAQNPRVSLTYLKKNGVIFEELWQVRVSKSANQNDVFVFVGVLPLQRTCHDENRLECSHTEIIMVLLRQLLRAQFVHLRHLLRQILGRLEALWVENDLRNQTWNITLTDYQLSLDWMDSYGSPEQDLIFECQPTLNM